MKFGFDRNGIRVLIVLAIAQVIGWGTIGLLAVVGRNVATDLHMDLAAIFAGNSVLYLGMGFCAPLLAKAFVRFGARPVLIAGTAIAAPGFVLLAVAHGPILYFVAWATLGIAGSASLSTSAYILLNEIAGRGARSAIGALMLVTGLSSSIFWPTTAWLSDALGWRGVCLAYAASMVLVSLPLYIFGVPRREKAQDVAPPVANSTAASTLASRGIFYLIVSSIALNAFVAFGLSAILIELLKSKGLPPAEAIAFASLLGVVQVSARAIDFLGGGRWDGITTGLVAGVALPVAMLILMIGDQNYWFVVAFILLYGLGSGALAVARATIPMVFYDREAYARAASHIALPLNMMSALAPPVLSGLLTRWGGNAVLELAAFCSLGSLLILVWLSRRRSRQGATAAA
jgi:MFS family permease